LNICMALPHSFFLSPSFFVPSCSCSFSFHSSLSQSYSFSRLCYFSCFSFILEY
jgi:hypothetical protein